MKVGLVGTGSYLGEIIESNEELERKVKNFDSKKSNGGLNEWLIKHYGIHSRVKTKELPSVLAFKACQKAIDNAGLEIEQIDFLILNTTSGDYKQPTTATKVQELLKMKTASFALEINMPCAGNLYGMAMAKAWIETGMGEYGLVVGVDKMSTNIDSTDFKLAGIFGDAAAACVVGKNPLLAINHSFLRSQWDEKSALSMPASGSAYPLDERAFQAKEHLLKMNGQATIEFIFQAAIEGFRSLQEETKLDLSSISQVIFHQASKAGLERVIKYLGLNPNQVHLTLPRYGNTSSASILLTLDEYLKENTQGIKNIYLIGMGSGLNWGAIHLNQTND